MYMVVAKHIFSNPFYTDRIQKLLKYLQIHSENLNLYLLAFVHRSLVHEKPHLTRENNERLEFLWDAILEMIITEKLYIDYPNEEEWVLTDYRSALVKWTHLAQVAKKLGFEEYLVLGKGEEKSWGRQNEYLLANCFEAFLWALYLDRWYEEVQKFILEHVYTNLAYILEHEEIKNYKSLLQEYTQEVFSITPEYKILEESGEDHDKQYLAWVFLGEYLAGKGVGKSKKKAHFVAAKEAYLNKDHFPHLTPEI